MTSGDQFRASGPPALTSPAYAQAHEEVRLLGAADSATRTADQTQIARFWADGAGTITPVSYTHLDVYKRQVRQRPRISGLARRHQVVQQRVEH